jgi:hypothetical protein
MHMAQAAYSATAPSTSYRDGGGGGGVRGDGHTSPNSGRAVRPAGVRAGDGGREVPAIQMSRRSDQGRPDRGALCLVVRHYYCSPLGLALPRAALRRPSTPASVPIAGPTGSPRLRRRRQLCAARPRRTRPVHAAHCRSTLVQAASALRVDTSAPHLAGGKY